MKNKKTSKFPKVTHQHPYEKIPWQVLSDKQKAHLLMNSTRWINEDPFLDTFKSWEQPEVIK